MMISEQVVVLFSLPFIFSFLQLRSFCLPIRRRRERNGKRYVRASGIIKYIFAKFIQARCCKHRKAKKKNKKKEFSLAGKEEKSQGKFFFQGLWGGMMTIHARCSPRVASSVKGEILAGKKYEKCNKFYYYDVFTSLRNLHSSRSLTERR